MDGWLVPLMVLAVVDRFRLTLHLVAKLGSVLVICRKVRQALLVVADRVSVEIGHGNALSVAATLCLLL